MQVIDTKLEGCFVIEPLIFDDDRGYFFESFNQKVFETLTNKDAVFVQDNQSMSCYGTVRGLHFQKGQSAQSKLVRVIEGTVFDVAVDLRPGSATFGDWFGIELSGDNNLQLFIPKGFAHGFSVLSPKALFTYKCDNYYDKAAESGIKFDDSDLNIDWRVPNSEIKVSDKDYKLPSFESFSKERI